MGKHIDGCEPELVNAYTLPVSFEVLENLGFQTPAENDTDEDRSISMRKDGFGELCDQCATNGTSKLGTILADMVLSGVLPDRV